MVNKRKRVLPEDVLNIVELIDEGRNWTYVAYMVGRSVQSCKRIYGQVRFAERMKDTLSGNWNRVHSGHRILVTIAEVRQLTVSQEGDDDGAAA